ncbi:LysE family translocator [Curvivirga sp.]|uniref:LysE family translocator n=1 Tax=Curvivirga sp. TaxID=2856848 RepID=UPI003B58BBAA
MSFESAVSFFIAVLIFSVTPGPGIFAILARALTKGAGQCVMLSLGMSVSDVFYLVAACFGLATIAQHWGELFTIIRFVGAAYLIYLGYKMWTAPVDLNGLSAKDSKKGHVMSFVQGFLISASNPKVILFYIAFLPTFMDLTVLNAQDIVLASVLTLVGLMIGLMVIAIFASQARRWFQSQSAMQKLNRSAGSIMVGAGAFLATRS